MTQQEKRDVEKIEAHLTKIDPGRLYSFYGAVMAAMDVTEASREYACELVFYVFARRLIQQPMEDILIELGVK